MFFINKYTTNEKIQINIESFEKNEIVVVESTSTQKNSDDDYDNEVNNEPNCEHCNTDENNNDYNQNVEFDDYYVEDTDYDDDPFGEDDLNKNFYVSENNSKIIVVVHHHI